MRLVDLEPRWLAFNDSPRAAFIFRCPHCRKQWLTCKSGPMTREQQDSMLLAAGFDPYESGCPVVECRQETAWSIKGEFENLTVTPSLDASASGHWHGFITDGNIVGGI